MRAMNILTVLLALSASVAGAATTPAQQAFDELARLQGQWESTSGRRHTVDFKLIANGTVLVETWTMSPTRTSMTVYAMDGMRLLATHFCPQGNQPRLRLAEKDADGRYQFRFLDGTNLQDPAGSHQHALRIEIDSADAFRRSETYVGNASVGEPVGDEGEAVAYRRIAPGKQASVGDGELRSGARQGE